ncbi:Coat F domain protein [Caprobacter fermentans]|uniref:Coat F domain protein n=1 Tax=Caproicibacter fermentans TaxID=2576756 RepID=A0A6N8HZ93_9FIRM|nr:spore coat protein [Caproicibacter fermentans]MVB10643.1 Coat F domain protein [Caproicibacter fermentans]OCN03254.1 coat protein F [Clostridium sp. W14A]QNK40924.1 spore coat protein [Caproicibacter fermentans]
MNFNQNPGQVSGTQVSSPMGERELMDDALASQKYMTDTYNTYTNECVTQNVRDEFMNILSEEHQIQSEVFDTMKKRGWYNVPDAQQQKIQQAKQKFQSQSSQG